MITVGGTLVLAIIVHMILFWIYKLRTFINRRCFATNLILPTSTSPKRRLERGSMGSSQVSMVFGENNNGCTNQAFKTSADKMYS